LQAHLDPVIDAICLQAMARDATLRFASMRELGKALKDYLQGSPPLASPEVAPVPTAVEPRPTPPSAAVTAKAVGPTATPTTVDDKIEFSCFHCGLLVRTPVSTAGKKGQCPTCGAVVQIPSRLGIRKAAESAKLVKPTPPQAAALSERFEFPCPRCRHAVGAAPGQAGRKGKCPNCGAVFDIPPAGNC
jgi:hypothetical protein